MCQTRSRKIAADGIDIDQLHYLNAECHFWVLISTSMRSTLSLLKVAGFDSVVSVCLDQRNCSTSAPVSTGIGDRVWVGKPYRYLTIHLDIFFVIPFMQRFNDGQLLEWCIRY